MGIGMAAGGIASSKSDDAKERARKAREEAAERRKEERERQARIRDLGTDLRTDVRRGGTSRDQITSGLSGGYSAVDRLKGLAGNEDLSRSARRRAGIEARQGYEKSLRSLYGTLDKLETRTEKAKDKLDDLKRIQDSVSSSIQGKAFELERGSELVSTGDGNFKQTSGVGHMRSSASAAASKVKDLSSKLKQLAKKGYSGAILQEVAQAGSIDESLGLANELLAGAADVSSLNSSYKDIAKYSNQAGAYVTEGFYEGGVNAAAGLVKGLESQQKTVEKTIQKIAKGMENSLKKALGIHSPSTVMYARGLDTAAGLNNALVDSITTVQDTAAQLGLAAVPVSSFGPISTDYNTDYPSSTSSFGPSLNTDSMALASSAPMGGEGVVGGEGSSWEGTVATTEEALTSMQALTEAAYLKMSEDTAASLLARQDNTVLAMTGMQDSMSTGLTTMSAESRHSDDDDGRDSVNGSVRHGHEPGEELGEHGIGVKDCATMRPLSLMGGAQ